MAKLEKLVRDKTPEFFKNENEYRIAGDAEIGPLLAAKLREEVDELCEALNTTNVHAVLEEMADVNEVLGALEAQCLISPHAVELRILQKRDERGGFDKRVVLQLKPPVPLILVCPECRGQHVDRGVWATIRIHRTHLCEHCGNLWRPCDYATVGVESVR